MHTIQVLNSTNADHENGTVNATPTWRSGDHEWRKCGGAWELHYLPVDAGIMRFANEFEALMLEAIVRKHDEAIATTSAINFTPEKLTKSKTSILKFKLSQSTNLQIPSGAQALSVHEQIDEIYIWVRANPKGPRETREFQVFSTGSELPGSGLNYIDSVFMRNGLVFHVFEKVDHA